ncbi:MAG: cytochrome c3 family protein, partial [Elusimicrobia bacterium]|nr:cytochrome c3 family protein [Elusimicrobiota bacterium]
MKILSTLLAAGWLAAAAAAAEAPKAAVNCRNCHTTGTPTKEKPALVKCPRAKVQGFHSVEEAVKAIAFPGKDEYGPVKFSHKAHAEMAEMGEGCGSCHHYNQARSIQKCGECHSPERLREGDALGKPDLQGAQHRLCISCHQSWGGGATCGSCHEMRGKAPAPPAKAKAPERVIFALASRKTVSFPHQAHS